jgi:hypothetical protein
MSRPGTATFPRCRAVRSSRRCCGSAGRRPARRTGSRSPALAASNCAVSPGSSRPSAAPRLSSSRATVRAPRMTDETAGRPRSQARAIWPGVAPSRRAARPRSRAATRSRRAVGVPGGIVRLLAPRRPAGASSASLELAASSRASSFSGPASGSFPPSNAIHPVSSAQRQFPGHREELSPGFPCAVPHGQPGSPPLLNGEGQENCPADRPVAGIQRVRACLPVPNVGAGRLGAVADGERARWAVISRWAALVLGVQRPLAPGGLAWRRRGRPPVRRAPRRKQVPWSPGAAAEQV